MGDFDCLCDRFEEDLALLPAFVLFLLSFLVILVGVHLVVLYSKNKKLIYFLLGNLIKHINLYFSEECLPHMGEAALEYKCNFDF